MSLDDIRAVLQASESVHFEGEKKEEVYAWVGACLGEQNWVTLGRTARGLVRRYLEKMTGLSRAQITREVRAKRSQRRCFPTVYTPEDVLLLATVDEAHETLSGPATQKILQRQFYDFQDQRFPRLAGISMAKYTVCARASGIGNCG
jgi:hypothetical protein